MSDKIEVFDILKNPNKILKFRVFINGYPVNPVTDSIIIEDKVNAQSKQVKLSSDNRFRRYVGMSLVKDVDIQWGLGTDFSIQLTLFDPYGWLVDTLIYSTPYGKSNCTIDLGWSVADQGEKRKREYKKSFQGILLLLDADPLVEGSTYRLMYRHWTGIRSTVNADKWFSATSRTVCFKNPESSRTSLKVKPYISVANLHNIADYKTTYVTKQLNSFAYVKFPMTLELTREEEVLTSTMTFKGTPSGIEMPTYIISVFPFDDFFNLKSYLPTDYYSGLLAAPRKEDTVDAKYAEYRSFSDYIRKLKHPPNHWFFYPTEDFPKFRFLSGVPTHKDYSPIFVNFLPTDEQDPDERGDYIWADSRDYMNRCKTDTNKHPNYVGRELCVRFHYPRLILKQYPIDDPFIKFVDKHENDIVIGSRDYDKDLTNMTMLDLIKPFADYYGIQIQSNSGLATIHEILQNYEHIITEKLKPKISEEDRDSPYPVKDPKIKPFVDEAVLGDAGYMDLIRAYAKKNKRLMNEVFRELDVDVGSTAKVSPFRTYTGEIPMVDFLSREPLSLNPQTMPGNLLDFKIGIIPSMWMIDTEEGAGYFRSLYVLPRQRGLITILPKNLNVKPFVIRTTGRAAPSPVQDPLEPPILGTGPEVIAYHAFCVDPLTLPRNRSSNYVSGLSFIVDLIEDAIKYHMIARIIPTGGGGNIIDNNFRVKTITRDNVTTVYIESAVNRDQENRKKIQVRRNYIINRDFGNVVKSFRVGRTELLIHGMSTDKLAKDTLDKVSGGTFDDLYDLEIVLENRATPIGDNRTSTLKPKEGITKESVLSSILSGVRPDDEITLRLNDGFREAMRKNYTMPGLMAELEIVGDPDIEPLDYVSIKLLRKDFSIHYFSGVYQILTVQHRAQQSGDFTTVLSLVRYYSTIGDVKLAGVSEFELYENSFLTPEGTAKFVDTPAETSQLLSGNIVDGMERSQIDGKKEKEK